MKFLLDQDVYLATALFLKQLGHDVVRVSEIGLGRAGDEDLLRVSCAQGRIFVPGIAILGASCFTVGSPLE